MDNPARTQKHADPFEADAHTTMIFVVSRVEIPTESERQPNQLQKRFQKVVVQKLHAADKTGLRSGAGGC